MTKRQMFGFAAMAALMVCAVRPSEAQQAQRRYEVSVTNITWNQRFTPVLVVTHSPDIALFQLGMPASPELARLAEEGDVMPLSQLLTGNPEVFQVMNSPAPPPASNLVAPGQTVRVMINSRGGFDRVSVAAMLIPTNDTFFAVNGVELPRSMGEQVMVMAPAYDSGTERNDETCASIPGPGFPECITPTNASGDGGGARAGNGEGVVHISAGVHGVGQLRPAGRDWRNPVARVVIRRVQ